MIRFFFNVLVKHFSSDRICIINFPFDCSRSISFPMNWRYFQWNFSYKNWVSIYCYRLNSWGSKKIGIARSRFRRVIRSSNSTDFTSIGHFFFAFNSILIVMAESFDDDQRDRDNCLCVLANLLGNEEKNHFVDSFKRRFYSLSILMYTRERERQITAA